MSGLYFHHGDKLVQVAQVAHVDITYSQHETPEINISAEDTYTMTLTLRPTDKKAWGRIFMMPRWMVTEWAFPRKKKRATRRRKRHGLH